MDRVDEEKGMLSGSSLCVARKGSTADMGLVEEEGEAQYTTARINIDQAPTIERGQYPYMKHTKRVEADLVAVSVEVTLSPTRPAPASKRESLASPPRQRRGIRPDDIVIAEEQAEAETAAAEAKAKAQAEAEAEEELARPRLPAARADSPLAQPRQKILDSDRQSFLPDFSCPGQTQRE